MLNQDRTILGDFSVNFEPISLKSSQAIFYQIPNSGKKNFPLIKTETDFFLRRNPEVAPGYNAGYSYAHAHITQIKNTRENCVHVTDYSGRQFSTLLMKYFHCN